LVSQQSLSALLGHGWRISIQPTIVAQEFVVLIYGNQIILLLMKQPK
jgi:hypothetical protein